MFSNSVIIKSFTSRRRNSISSVAFRTAYVPVPTSLRCCRLPSSMCFLHYLEQPLISRSLFTGTLSYTLRRRYLPPIAWKVQSLVRAQTVIHHTRMTVCISKHLSPAVRCNLKEDQAVETSLNHLVKVSCWLPRHIQ